MAVDQSVLSDGLARGLDRRLDEAALDVCEVVQRVM